MRPSPATYYREEAVKWFLSITGALLVYAIVAAITLRVYHPDVDHLRRVAEDLLAETWNVMPEPMEAMLFRLGVLTIVPSLYGFYLLFSRGSLPASLAHKTPFVFLTVIALSTITGMVVCDFLAENTSDNTSRITALGANGVGNTNFNFYFQDFFLGQYFWLYAFVIAPAVCGLFFFRHRVAGWKGFPLFVKVATYAAYLLLAAVVACIFAMNTFSFPYSVENRLDFSAVYYSVTQVYAGTPMLVDGFTNTYGLYPHFLAPIFKLTGLSVPIFSFTMSLLLTLSFAMNFYVIRKFTANRAIMLLGFATMLFFGYLNRKLATHFDSYFALFPIRYIIPSTLLFLATKYLSAPSVRKYWVTTFIMAAFILWNPEIGLTCYLAWLAMNIHRDFFGLDGRVAWRKMATHVVGALLVACAVCYTFKLIIWLCYGSEPDLGMLFGTTAVFSAIGFGLLPMATVHPWHIMALAVILGFVFTISKWYKKSIAAKDSIVLLLTLVSLGYLFYFQGRSHSAHFSSCMPFCVLLLTIFGDELWTIVKKGDELLFKGLFVVFLFITSFPFIELVYGAPAIAAAVSQAEDKTNYDGIVRDMMANKELVEKTSSEYEKILVIMQKKHQPLMFDGNKRVSAFNPGLIDLFLKNDAKKLERLVADSSFTIYMESSDDYYPFLQRTYGVIGARYEYADVGHCLVALKPRKTRVPGGSFMNRTVGQVLYRKYHDNAEGYKTRANDAMGLTPVSVGTSYSVEALFFNSPQMFPEATVIGDASGKNGFAIGHMFNSSRYFFYVNDFAFLTTVPNNRWIYLCMNVAPDHMDVYINGTRMPRQLLKEPSRDPGVKLSIGDMSGEGKPRYFIGAISEVNISRGNMDSSTVAATWSNISQSVR